MSQNYLISIIVPVYNAAEYVKSALEDLFNQSYTNIEVLLINDGSTDSSDEKIGQFLENNPHSKIKYTHLDKNQGVSHARNIGLNQAEGEFVLFVDIDDSMPVHALEYLVKTIKNGDADLVVGQAELVYQGKQPLFNKFKERFKQKLKRETSFVHENPELIFKINAFITSKLYRKTFIADIRFDEQLTMAEDLLFVKQILDKNPKVAVVDEVVYNYTVDTSASLSKREHHSDSFFRAFRLIRQFPDYQQYHEEFNFVILQNMIYEYMQRAVRFDSLSVDVARKSINDFLDEAGRDQFLKNKYFNRENFLLKFVGKSVLKNRNWIWTIVRTMK